MSFDVTDHAAERYIERVKPLLSLSESRAELMRLHGAGSYSVDRPAWLHDNAEDEADLWLILCDSIAIPLTRDGSSLVAMTVLTRSGISAESRAYRNRGSARRRFVKKQSKERDGFRTRDQKRADRKRERRAGNDVFAE